MRLRQVSFAAFGLALLVTAGALAFRPASVAAYSTAYINASLPGGMPLIYAAETQCTNRLYGIPSGTSVAQKRANVNNSTPYPEFNYVSAAGQRNVDSITVPYGDTTPIGLQYNQLDFLCAILVGINQNDDRFTASNAFIVNSPADDKDGFPVRQGSINYTSLDSIDSQIVGSTITSGSGSLSNFIGSVSTVSFDPNSRYWFNNPIGFSYTPQYPMHSNKISIQLFVKRINTFGGTSYCVRTAGATGGPVANRSDFSSCPPLPVYVDFYINAKPFVDGVKIDDSGLSKNGSNAGYGGNMVFPTDRINAYTDSGQANLLASTASNPFAFQNGTQLNPGSTYITDADANAHPGWQQIGYSYCYGTYFDNSIQNWVNNPACNSAYLTQSANIKSGSGFSVNLQLGDEIHTRWIYKHVDLCDNIPGLQTSVPPGRYQSGSSCPWLPPIVDGAKIDLNKPNGGGPFTDNTVNILDKSSKVINTTTANPYTITVNSADVMSDSYSSSQSPAGASDGFWFPKGFTFCDEALKTCKKGYSGAEPVHAPGDKVTMVSNHHYRLNWLYQYIDICSSTTLSGSGEANIGSPTSVSMDFGPVPAAYRPDTSGSLTMVVDAVSVKYGYNVDAAGLLQSDQQTVQLYYGTHTAHITLLDSKLAGGGFTCDKPYTVGRHPYFKVYGGDIFAGGAFKSGASCTPPALTTGGLSGSYNSATGGAGTELAAIALLQVDGVASADLRLTSPRQPSGLTIANTSGVAGTAFGGYSKFTTGGTRGYCAPDYFTELQYSGKSPSTPTPTVINSSTIDAYTDLAEGQTIWHKGGILHLNSSASNAPFTKRSTLFVDGDLSIEKSIVYPPTYGSSVDTIPYLTVVVRGNIYIDEQVSELDGVFIAQPNSSGTRPGRIYTCRTSPNGSAVTPTKAVTDCAKQLLVRGALIAKSIALQRTVGGIGFATPYEPATSTNSAEIINFTPEFYLGKPAYQPTGAKPDTVTSRPPTL